VARFRASARRAGLTDVAMQASYVRFAPVELRESQQLRLQRLHPGSLLKPTIRSILVPRPTTARVGGTPLRDVDLLRWASEVVDTVIGDGSATAHGTAPAPGTAQPATTEGRS
jgi:transcription-repair coupling factor (superfamily II helicase)